MNSTDLSAEHNSPPADAAGDGRLLKTREVAELLASSTRYVQHLTQAGRLRCYRLASRPGAVRSNVRYRRADVEAFIESCAVRPLERRRAI